MVVKDSYVDQKQQSLMLLDDINTALNPPVTDLVAADQLRSIVRQVGDRLVVDMDRIDIFSKTTKQIPDWKPKINLRSYQSLTKLFVDIETTGGIKDPRNQAKETELLMIGCRNEKSADLILSIGDMDEKEMLQRFLRLLDRKRPNLLLTFNGMYFDIPYLVGKFEQHGLKHPFFISDRISTFRTAQKFGKPSVFNAIYLKWGQQQTHHIDLYHQTLAFDYVARKLTAHSLKEAPLQLGLRDEARLDLGYQGILDCHARKDYEPLKEYLKFDLEDSELLGDFLVPSIYYQQLFCNEFALQALATMGNATKWNSSLKDEYKGIQPEPQASDHMKITGGKVFANAGFYRGVSKFDVASLYPTIQLNYGICTIKDPQLKSLAIKKYGRQVRLGFKTLKNFVAGSYEGSAQAYLGSYREAITLCLEFSINVGYDAIQVQILNDLLADVLLGNDTTKFLTELKKLGKGFFKNEAAIKVYLNSGYGFLNTTGIPYNDPIAGSLVTAVGRKILDFMKDFCVSQGAKIVNMDTDAVTICTNEGTWESNDRVYQALQAALPEWIEIEHELYAEHAYIPPVNKIGDYDKSYKVESVNGKKLFYKVFDTEHLPDIDEAYVYWINTYFNQRVNFSSIYETARRFQFKFPDKEGLRKNYVFFLPGGKVKSYGRYSKRDRNILDKKWQIEYLQCYAVSPSSAETFYQETRSSILSGEYQLENLSIKKTIPKNDVTMVNLNIGKHGDSVTVYMGQNGILNNGEYDRKHYASKLDELYDEIQTAFLIQRDSE